MTADELRQFNQDGRDSIRGKNNFMPTDPRPEGAYWPTQAATQATERQEIIREWDED